MDDFVEDVGFVQHLDSSVAKEDKNFLRDEEADEDLDENNNTSQDGVWININDLWLPRSLIGC